MNASGKRHVVELSREKFDELTSTHLQSTIYNILCGDSVYFCNAAKKKINSITKESLLEKIYTRDLFTAPDMSSCLVISRYDIENIASIANKEFCSNCAGRDNNNLFNSCPYVIAASVIALARIQKINSDNIFRLLLGEKRMPFDNEKQDLYIDINPEDIKDIESKSAYAAYLMLRDGFIRSSVVDDSICYSAVRLCDYGDKNVLI